MSEHRSVESYPERERGGDVPDLREAAAELLLREENGCMGSFRHVGGDTPYRDWFHADEHSFVVAMRLRLALGLSLPPDVTDLRGIIVAGAPDEDTIPTLAARGE